MNRENDQTGQSADDARDGFDPNEPNSAAAVKNIPGQDLSGVEGESSELAEARAALVKAEGEAAEFKDKMLRTLAEFENFKKRAAKERSDLIRYQGEAIVVEVLEVLDGFERALAHADADPASLIGGLKMIHKQFVDALGRFEIRGESCIGKQFDPVRQRAIGKEKREGVAANEVVAELKKAYQYRDKLVRLGEVVVAEGAE